MTAPYTPQDPQKPSGLRAYNPMGSFRSTFQPLTPRKPKPPQDPNAPVQPAPAQGTAPAPAPVQPQQTFAQMQAAGQARPAPPPPPAPSPSFAMSPAPSGAQSFGAMSAPVQGGSAPYGGQLNQTISQALANPSAYGTPQVLDAYQRMSQNIDDEFTQRNGQLQDEMARRGLSESTINSGRGYSLNVEKRSAKTDLAQQLMDRMAQTYGADRAAAIAAGLQGSSQANQNALNWAQLGQQGEQFGQNLDLQRQLGLGNLGVSQGDLALRQQLGQGNLALQNRQLDSSNQQSDLDRALRQTLGLGELDLNRQQLAQQGAQFQSDLGLRQELGRGELGLNQQKLGFDQANQSADRALRQQLGLGELNINQQRTNNDLTLGQNQLLGSVLNTLMNSNVDLSTLPAGFLNTVLGRATTSTGGGSSSGGGATFGTGSGPWWEQYPVGGGGTAAPGGTGTSSSTGTPGSPGGSSPTPSTPQWQLDPATGTYVDQRNGQRWSEDAVRQYASQNNVPLPSQLAAQQVQMPGLGAVPGWQGNQALGRTYQVNNGQQWVTIPSSNVTAWKMAPNGLPEPDWTAMGMPDADWRSYSGASNPWGTAGASAPSSPSASVGSAVTGSMLPPSSVAQAPGSQGSSSSPSIPILPPAAPEPRSPEVIAAKLAGYQRGGPEFTQLLEQMAPGTGSMQNGRPGRYVPNGTGGQTFQPYTPEEAQQADALRQQVMALLNGY